MDSDALARLYGEEGRGLFLLARSVTGDDHLAEDAVQHVFARMLEGEIEAPSRGYIYKSVKNASLNVLRTRRRADRRDRKVGLSTPLFLEPDDGIGHGEDVQRALLELPEEQREVVVMKVWGELSYDEISDAVGVSPNTAASRYRYGIKRMRKALSEVLEP